MLANATERILAKCTPVGECWVWTGASLASGYGVIGIRRTFHGIHRVTYTYFRSPIPEGTVLDHLCENKLCANPWHLEPVTIGENLRRARRSGRTGWGPKERCRKGHELRDGNLYVPPSGRRECRTCRQIRFSERRR